MKMPPEIVELLTVDFAYRHKVVPLEATNGLLKVGVCNAGDLQLLNDLEFFLGKHVQPVEMPEHEILRALEKIYGTKPLQNDIVNPQRTVGERSRTNEFQILRKDQEHQQEPELGKEGEDQSVVSLVNQIITEAIKQGVSDVHIEAYEREVRVRYRSDGVLKDVLHPPLGKKHAIISRLKIMADLDIAEKRRPQDGRIRVGSTSSPTNGSTPLRFIEETRKRSGAVSPTLHAM